MKLNFTFIFVMLFANGFFSCATASIMIQTDTPARVEEITGDPKEAGTFRGETPLALNRTNDKTTLLRLSAIGRDSVYVVTSCGQANETRLNIKLPTMLLSPALNGKDGPVTINKALRVLLKAYQALSQKDTATARLLAKQVSDMAPGLAAPHIVAGIAALQAGDRAEAAASFARAQSIDPEDRELDALIRSAQ
jgi:hypothetical protein